MSTSQRPRANINDRDSYIHATDTGDGEDFDYPIDPNDDADHLRCCLSHGPLKPGYRYGYNNRGDVVCFRVAEGAKDFVPRQHRRRGTRSQSHTRHHHHRGRPRYSSRHRDGHDEASGHDREEGNSPVLPYEIESPSSSPELGATPQAQRRIET
ncbi:hypothetical protein F5B20DRAFT_550161 [Whalleya microplaca]|nr:hypothetical protein F5B20DRAFT_550161 [Whalleya microplaca]